MQVASCAPLLRDVAKDPLDVFRLEVDRICQGFRRQPVVVRVQAEIHLLVGQGEIEFVLGLRQ